MSPHHIFAIFLLAINAAAATKVCVRNRPVPAAFPVDFECTLDVGKLTQASYSDFITELRTEVGMGGEQSGNVPILPYYGYNPHLFDVVLKIENENFPVTVRVRVRRDNLYVRGFRMQTVPNQWMEFETQDGRHMVDPSSKFLTFGDSYPDMEAKAGVRVREIHYTKEELMIAVRSLSKRTTEDGKINEQGQAKALIVVAQMISEAARFQIVSSFFEKQLDEGKKLPFWMFQCVQRRWKVLSGIVQCSYKIENYIYEPVTINRIKYENATELRDKVFGVMLEFRPMKEETCRENKYECEREAAAVLSAVM